MTAVLITQAPKIPFVVFVMRLCCQELDHVASEPGFRRPL